MPHNQPNPLDPAAVRRWAAANQPDPHTVTAWAAPLLDRAHQLGPVPLAGSPEWRALADTDPRKPASVVLAALARLADATPEATAHRLRAELAERDQDARRRLREVSRDVSAAWAEIHPQGYNHLSHAELVRRRTTYPTPARTPEQIRAAVKRTQQAFASRTQKENAA